MPVINLKAYRIIKKNRAAIGFFEVLVKQLSSKDLDLRLDLLLNELRSGMNSDLSVMKLNILCEEYLKRPNMPRRALAETFKVTSDNSLR